MNLMIDLETMGTKSDSIITQIGLVLFDRDKIVSEFKVNVDINDAIRRGLSVEGDTLYWWLKQSDEARKSIYSGKKLTCKEATLQIYDWLKQNGITNQDDAKDLLVWGNGSDFDNVIFANFLVKSGGKVFWKFWNNRCFRTALTLTPSVVRVQPKVAHDALEDAKAQALTLIGIWKNEKSSLRH